MQHNTHVNTHSVDTAIPFKISITSPETLNCVNVHLYSAVQLHVGSHTLVALGKHNIFFKKKGVEQVMVGKGMRGGDVGGMMGGGGRETRGEGTVGKGMRGGDCGERGVERGPWGKG